VSLEWAYFALSSNNFPYGLGDGFHSATHEYMRAKSSLVLQKRLGPLV